MYGCGDDFVIYFYLNDFSLQTIRETIQQVSSWIILENKNRRRTLNTWTLGTKISKGLKNATFE